ncbi:MAG: hypothetical protein E6Q93_14060 [Burkholderiaceae bacterium]|nr:MAG: hypothetical protein E6Q93_14060 [Burkholderiaceae bacterium]
MSTVTGVVPDAPPEVERPQGRRGGVAVLSAHGGSAATTVADRLQVPELVDSESSDQLRLLVVTARTTVTGFDRLLACIADLPVPVRVVVAATADAPVRAPAGVRARAKTLQRSGREVAMVTLPYEPSWRYCPPTLQRTSKTYARQIAKLAAVINQHERTDA